MYYTFQEVLLAVKEKYQGIKQLSKKKEYDTNRTFCLYGHQINGVGCAIGCLFPADIAAKFDRRNNQDVGLSLTEIAEIFPEFYQTINPELDIYLLSRLQRGHDLAFSVEDFISYIDNALERETIHVNLDTEKR